MRTSSISSTTAKTPQRKTKNKGIMKAYWAQSLASMPVLLASTKAVKGMKEASKISKQDSIQLSKCAQKALKDTGLYDKGVRAYKIQEVSAPKITKKTIENFIQIFKEAKEGKTDTLTSTFKKLKEHYAFGKKDIKALNALADEVAQSKGYKKLEKNIISQLGNKEGTKVLKEMGLPQLIAKIQSIMFKQGDNACYLPKANKIITPSKTLQTSIFHEMGHALNNNGNIILKGLQKMRPVAKFAPAIILATSLLNKRKTEEKGSKNDSIIQKSADFIKKHAPALTLLAYAPMVLEEGLASLRGQGVAKKLVQSGDLSKELYKKIKQTNLGGFSTYVVAGLAAAIGAKVAIAVKDKAQAKYEAKQEAKLAAKNK